MGAASSSLMHLGQLHVACAYTMWVFLFFFFKKKMYWWKTTKTKHSLYWPSKWLRQIINLFHLSSLDTWKKPNINNYYQWTQHHRFCTWCISKQRLLLFSHKYFIQKCVKKEKKVSKIFYRHLHFSKASTNWLIPVSIPFFVSLGDRNFTAEHDLIDRWMKLN